MFKRIKSLFKKKPKFKKGQKVIVTSDCIWTSVRGKRGVIEEVDPFDYMPYFVWIEGIPSPLWLQEKEIVAIKKRGF
jgi:hypothetical protein